ncbi:hypothetical protein O0544_11895 [Edwardsiella anguillarum]|nr:hypothetical protein [Edwardsiella anguillarum]
MMNTTVSFEAKGYEDIPALLAFLQRNLQCGELSIEMTADDFYAQATITALENGAHFMTMNACGYRIEHHIACDLHNRRLYLIYSDHKMQWGEEGLNCTLPYRDSFLIDSTKSFRIASPGYQKHALSASHFPAGRSAGACDQWINRKEALDDQVWG